jgi:ribose transport system ATP-binding protein
MRWRSDWPELRRRRVTRLERAGARISPSTPARDPGAAQKQVAEIARVLARNVRALIFDEAASSMTAQRCSAMGSASGRCRRQRRPKIAWSG